MKLKNGFILRKVGRQFVVAATGEASKNFNGMIRLNDEAAYAFGLLQGGVTEEELVAALLSEYDVDEATAKTHVAAFVGKLKEHDFLD